MKVRKVGRTTATTSGRVTAFELDNVMVGYDLGNLSFDNHWVLKPANSILWHETVLGWLDRWLKADSPR